eukprot:274411-Pleurochrysis_carterae.AAC.1
MFVHGCLLRARCAVLLVSTVTLASSLVQPSKTQPWALVKAPQGHWGRLSRATADAEQALERGERVPEVASRRRWYVVLAHTGKVASGWPVPRSARMPADMPACLPLSHQVRRSVAAMRPARLASACACSP